MKENPLYNEIRTMTFRKQTIVNPVVDQISMDNQINTFPDIPDRFYLLSFWSHYVVWDDDLGGLDCYFNQYDSHLFGYVRLKQEYTQGFIGDKFAEDVAGVKYDNLFLEQGKFYDFSNQPILFLGNKLYTDFAIMVQDVTVTAISWTYSWMFSIGFTLKK